MTKERVSAVPDWKIAVLHASRAQYLAEPKTAVSWNAMQHNMALKYGLDLEPSTLTPTLSPTGERE
jgi:hypothetical protein